jgi:hypothetical protein
VSEKPGDYALTPIFGQGGRVGHLLRSAKGFRAFEKGAAAMVKSGDPSHRLWGDPGASGDH